MRNTVKKKNSFFSAQETCRVFCRIARRLNKKDFVNAESFAARDKICRVFAAECFELYQKFEVEGNHKLSLQYIKLSAKMLGMSLRPKRLEDIDALKQALSDLKEETEG